MIHCDEVFDILTRGPFPTGAPSDGIVESHLNHCDTCRQLAEALRPAIELLQEAISPEESGGLPRYGGTATDSPTTWFDHGAAPLKTKQAVAPRRNSWAATRPRPSHLPWRSAARFAAAACIGLALAGMLRQLVVSHESFRRGVAQPVAVAAYWRLATEGRQWAADQGLSDGCRQPIDGFTVAAAPLTSNVDDALQLACCLSCHAARHDRLLPAARVSGFVQACQACH